MDVKSLFCRGVLNSRFTLALPSRGASWLDKCKSIGPEIERAAKSYSIHSRIGKIDGDYFPYESFKSFGDLNALAEKKYAIWGTCFERWGFLPVLRPVHADIQERP